MFETLDTMIALGVIFLILSMVNKYLISLVKRIFKIKAKVITKELETFIGEKTSKYLIPYLEAKAKHLNFLDKTNIKKKIVLRELNKEQLKTVVSELEAFMKSENADEFKKVFGIDISVDDIKKKVQGELDEIKAHLNTLKDKVENMYDNTMEKISEVYETKIRYRALYFGIALAFCVNADFFGIYNSLSKSPAIRAQLVAQTDIISAKMEDLDKQIRESGAEKIENKEEIKDEITKIKATLDNIKNTGLELGWTKKEFGRVFKYTNEEGEEGREEGGWTSVGTSIVYKLIGLLVAGLLISFGAPFWHDFIGTFTGLRKTLRGKKEGSGESNTTTPENPLMK